MGGAVVDEGPTGVKAPDGGWGWAVLFGCFVITGFSYAFPKPVLPWAHMGPVPTPLECLGDSSFHPWKMEINLRVGGVSGP
ncbi:SLC16A3 isoform 8, partial [Pan troglodytes]